MNPFWQNIFRSQGEKNSHVQLTIRQIRIFKNLSKRELTSVENIIHIRKYLIGETIFKVNTPDWGCISF